MKLFLIILLSIPALGAGFVASSDDPLTPATIKAPAVARSMASSSSTNSFKFNPTIPAGGTAAGPFRYYVASKDDPAPIAKGGFQVSFPLNKDDLAGKEDGYPDVDANGWPCRIQKSGGDEFRVYRLKRKVNGEIQLTVKTK
jgi:hypothetical protein